MESQSSFSAEERSEGQDHREVWRRCAAGLKMEEAGTSPGMRAASGSWAGQGAVLRSSPQQARGPVHASISARQAPLCTSDLQSYKLILWYY